MASTRSAPTLADARRITTPSAALETEIRRHLDQQLGRVLPPVGSRRRDINAYYDAVILGRRSLDVLRTLQRHRPAGDLPILDLGCGLGTLVLLANATGLPAIGVEPGEVELTLAHQRLAEAGLDSDLVRAGEGERLPLDDASVSMVLMHDVLEHVRDWRAVLAETHRVLMPGGLAYIKGPNYTLRFVEPHYQMVWLPQMPKALARRYLALRSRDVAYLEHIGYRRRGAVLRELRALGFELSFPRLDKLNDPELVNRPWARKLVSAAAKLGGPTRKVAARAMEHELQWVIDVLARRPDGSG
jgi:SAM-dependent methyltransferase